MNFDGGPPPPFDGLPSHYASFGAAFPKAKAKHVKGPSSAKRDNGVGYAGDDSHDKKRRQQGRQAAVTKEMDLMKSQLQQLQSSHVTLEGTTTTTTSLESEISICSSPPSNALVDTLKQVLRNHDPQLWSSSAKGGERHQLVEAALKTCQLITKHHPKFLGRDDDDESILFALEELAQTSELLVQHYFNQNVSPSTAATRKKSKTRFPKDVALAQKVLTTREEAQRASKTVAEELPDCLAVDVHEHYRKSLRPHAFEFVEKLQGHAFANQPKTSSTNSNRSKALLRELLTYKTALPVEYGSTILVRAVESRMDLLRVCILGPEDTPYANGCFVFDVHLPSTYPNKPPKVKFLTTGGGKFRFNPNLYNCGKVCLSLLGTWSGPSWQPGESTLLQVLVSIQSLILVPDPYFNEPGYQASQGTDRGKRQSDQYNANIRHYTVSAAIVPFLRTDQQPPEGNHPFPELATAIKVSYELKHHSMQQQLFNWNKADTTGQIAALYSQCWKIWEEQKQQQKRMGRKRRAKAVTDKNIHNFTTTTSMNIRNDGVIELDLDDEETKSCVASSSSASKKPRKTNVDVGGDDGKDKLGIWIGGEHDGCLVEIDLDDDNERKQSGSDNFKPRAAAATTETPTIDLDNAQEDLGAGNEIVKPPAAAAATPAGGTDGRINGATAKLDNHSDPEVVDLT